MGNNVIKYGPVTLARLAAELDEPITSAITNPAPIEHGLVMARLRTLAANLAVGGALCAAFDAGVRWLQDVELESYEVARNAWEPGCGRAWGGGA